MSGPRLKIYSPTWFLNQNEWSNEDSSDNEDDQTQLRSPSHSSKCNYVTPARAATSCSGSEDERYVPDDLQTEDLVDIDHN